MGANGRRRQERGAHRTSGPSCPTARGGEKGRKWRPLTEAQPAAEELGSKDWVGGHWGGARAGGGAVAGTGCSCFTQTPDADEAAAQVRSLTSRRSPRISEKKATLPCSQGANYDPKKRSRCCSIIKVKTCWPVPEQIRVVYVQFPDQPLEIDGIYWENEIVISGGSVF